jgi:thiol-disulfide isomerase/thioredoxin
VRINKGWLLATTFVAASLVLTGCSSSDALSKTYKEGTNQNYISGTGIDTYAESSRKSPVAFSSTTDTGKKVSSKDYAGKVLVINFWYAGCAPCRLEAPMLESLATKYAGKDVEFLGVNVRDQAVTSRNFAKDHDITYPSVIDSNDGNMLLAFAGKVPANAVPTTLVIDEKGRVAARILGELDSTSILNTFISDTLSEGD